MLDLPPIDQGLSETLARLGEVAARNSASAIGTRISASKAAKKDDQTIAELQEIIQELLEDRNELMLIATALKEALTAQTIDGADIQYVANTLIPAIEGLLVQFSDGEELDNKSKQIVEALRHMLSPQILMILQLLGFNYKQAIGQPLTDLVQAHIRCAIPSAGGASNAGPITASPGARPANPSRKRR